ncbi:hypothetical protein CJF30_00003858 [Rutstroemia sp. NJR-2017a BBW]|nr:hypothetical protein CJF30_00003858 [Rutstroemia sp. NJR-2017a BBW]
MAPLSQRNTGARRYSIDQLLGMRNSLLIVNCPVEKINQQLNIVASLFRIPHEALQHAGNYSCLTKTLSAIKHEKHHSVEKRLPESSEDSEYHDHRKSGNRSIHEQSTGWHLRARTSFDTRRTLDNQVQPHSAPTNAATHQAENFRRFYRAVVSPTHVRVTAGGRIVPNTRATAPPTFDPMPDQLSISASKRSNDLDQVDKAKSTLSGSSDYLQGRNIVDGNPSLDEYSASFQPPFLPSYNYLPQGSSMSMATMSHPIDGQFYHRANATGSSRVSGGGSGGKVSGTQSIRISPPTQFDQTRPYLVYNNQVFLPAPGFPPPLNGFAAHSPMIGSHPFAAPMHAVPPPGHFMPPGMLPISMTMPMPMGSFAPLMAHTNGQALPVAAPPAHPQLGQFQPMLPLLPGHIEHHLHYLRQHLMSLDNHIANHSLQDDYHASNQRQTLIDEIIRLKSLLQAAQNPSHNFQAPKNHVPSTINAQDSLSSQASEDHHKPISTTAGISNINTNMNDQTYSGYTSQPVPSVQSIDSPSPQEYISKKFSTPIVGSRLPATAAMAPPFQPRSQAPLTAAQMEVFAMTSPGRNSPPATPESQLERQQRLLNRAETRWEDSAVGTSLNRPVPVPAFRRSDTYPICSSELHSITNAPKVASQAARVLPSDVPYLRGHLTDVGGTGHGKYSGFEYCRPLTEAENTAREIYFGTNTQNKSTRDLPKFDGQDFYPPSPVRGSSTIPTTRGGGKSVMDWDTHCKNLFLTPQKAQTSPPSPVCATASSQALVATAERSFSDKFSFQAGERRFGSTDTSHRPISEPSGTFTSEFLANLFVKPDTQETAYNVFQKGQRGSGSNAPSILEASCDADVEAAHIGESGSGASNDEVSRRGTMKNPNFSTLFTDPNWGKSDENLSNDPPVEHHEKVLSSDKVACSLESDSPEKAFLRNIINEAAMSAHEAPLTIQPKILASDDFTPVETYGIPSEHGSSIKSHSSFKRTSIYPPVTEDGSPKRRPSFAQRIASTNSSDQKPQSFLSMLKLNVSRAPVAAPAYVSSNNAQGSFHSQHRGSAVASLAPAMVNVATTPRISGSATPLSPRIYDYPVTPENRNRLRYDPVLHRSPEALAAEDYASYLKGSARAKETR